MRNKTTALIAQRFGFIALVAVIGFYFGACGDVGDSDADGTGGGNQTPIEMVMVQIQGGTFTMGSPETEAGRNSDETQHQITLTKGFYMGKYPVTQAQYEAVTGTNPSYHKTSVSHETSTANRPVEFITWYDAIEYCNRRSQGEGLTLAYAIDKSRRDPNNTNEYDNVKWVVTWNRNANGYRLPTEAEWEYACRAGTTTPFNTGNNITTDQANYDGDYPYNGNPAGIARNRTTEVGSFAPNGWGLYDMHGNVLEWCWDWYGTYESGGQSDPTGAVSGGRRVLRGGYFGAFGQSLRSAARSHYVPWDGFGIIGFRLVRSAQ